LKSANAKIREEDEENSQMHLMKAIFCWNFLFSDLHLIMDLE